MQSASSLLMVLGTGGTIAGRGRSGTDHVDYRSGELAVSDLLHGVPVPDALAVQAEQVANIDSKDMDVATWQALARRAAQHLARPEVRGLVVTHGTDTLEETAWLLHRVLAPRKPLVLTAAMRPATSLQADGPQNLADALAVAAEPGAQGVLVVMAGQVHGAADVRKRHSWRVDAFGSGDAGPLAVLEQGRLRRFRPWPEGRALGLDLLSAHADAWPWVEIVTSHAGARAAGVDAWVDAGVQGLVVAGTGNGTVHQHLARALQRAEARGVAVRLVTRCAQGAVVPGQAHAWPVHETLGAPQSRVELLLELLTSSHRGDAR